ncbi:variable surface protein [Plasmodium gonderi]|uniref:Variable surface protein n=1 Tax=Plasmodium gonderi TaxID=77519 RepID=A0A1Y1JPV6_PLAGO|nr:variable surface protein [Plasmodium gonderi]GAW84511.1 variable surface protein [Plasmodium gonderi]
MIMERYTLGLFPICKEIMDKNKGNETDIVKSWCQKIKSSSHGVPRINENICLRAMYYLDDISYIIDESLLESSCKYLYYWIFHTYTDINNVEDYKKIYDDLLTSYVRNAGAHKCNIYSESFNGDFMSIFRNMHSIRKYFNENKTMYLGNLLKDQIFIDTISIIKKNYNDVIEKPICEECTLLTRNDTSITTPIAITFVATLLILVFSFILYKYTAFGSCLLHNKKGLKLDRNNIDDEWNEIQPLGISSNISNDNKYMLLYK